MPFENLGDKLQSAFKDLRGKGKLSESDIDGALREVRRALLEADVNFKVAKDFIAHVREKAMGEHYVFFVAEANGEIAGSLTRRSSRSSKTS